MYLHLALLILFSLCLSLSQLITKTGRAQLIIRVLENHVESRHLNNLLIVFLPNNFGENNCVSNLILCKSKKTHPFNTLKEHPAYTIFLAECSWKMFFYILHSKILFPISSYMASSMSNPDPCALFLCAIRQTKVPKMSQRYRGTIRGVTER